MLTKKNVDKKNFGQKKILTKFFMIFYLESGTWDSGFRIWDSEVGIQDLGFGICDLGFWIWDSGSGIQDLGLRRSVTWDSGFGIQDLGLRIWDLDSS